MNLKHATLLHTTLVLMLCAFGSGRLQAQVASATLSGRITSPLGTVIPDARVSLKNVTTGQSIETQADANGVYKVLNLAPAEYEVSASAKGYRPKAAKVALRAGSQRVLDLVLGSGLGQESAPSLQDLGFSPAQIQGSPQYQAMLDKRSHMLQLHQQLGLITTAPLLAAILTSPGAKGRHGTPGNASGRDVHAGLGAATAALYFTSAYFAIRAPKIPDAQVHGPIRVHKALAWIHGPGMILTPVLGAIAFSQLNRGERVHGIAKYHSWVAWTTAGAYGAAIVSVSVKL